MSLPRNDSSSIISSLQMDYGDSDEEENDSKNNSYSNSDTMKTATSSPEEKTKETQQDSTSNEKVIETESTKDVDMKDAKIEDIKTDDHTPVDFISDDEDDSHKHHSQHQHHHHHHHHHRHKDEHKSEGLKEEERIYKAILPDTLNTDSPASQSSIKLGKKATALVSYGPDEDVGSSDDDDNDSGNEKIQDQSHEDSPVLNASDASILSRSVQNLSKDDIEIPPEPQGKCPYQLQRQIELEYQRMVREGVDHNRNIQEKKMFRNPSIYEKLIDFCHIDENGTNFPPEIYNPHVWGKESFYDELDKAQRKDMERREKDKKDRTKIEFMTGTKKPASAGQPESLVGPDEKKRKTKWDAQPGNIQGQYAKLPSAQQNPGVVNLTATVTGTKGKVISAVGSLSKKSSN